MQWKPIINLLRQRRVLVALATLIAAVAGAFGLETDVEPVLTVLGAGAAIVLVLAGLDARRKAKTGTTEATDRAERDRRGPPAPT